MDHIERESRMLNEMNSIIRQLIEDGWYADSIYDEVNEMIDDALLRKEEQ